MIKRLLMYLSLVCAMTLTAVSGAAAQGAMSQGEVTRVDAAHGKLTLKHDGVKNLSMPAMSMVFRVKDASMLAKLKPGDRVLFSAAKVDGEYTITTIEPAR